MYFDDEAWVTRGRKRKVYRDRMREKFFKETGLKKLSDTQDMEGAPQKQRIYTVTLMNLSRKGIVKNDITEICTKMAKELKKLGLGTGVMGDVAKTKEDLSQYTMKNLRDFFVSPAFFD
ncbi:hypothetical protein N5853_00875 [Bartonella sp. HY329]|uniref:hypothetical protein n=1 Tax=unclassified Bartonella TaxID=2645622 RepID=UPI0021C86701|nr:MULTISPECIES: hypothetical protein [unclassified Bartonella]UXM95242.1 hypothetical protein N5853_00875 [Bartonella sp. HY329]UXN09566.1 hypothetical protein N5852_00880 [Bartonella sp. HY328]